ncbi:MAG: dephospho-CoA kinase [Bacteroidaceae bacterium]|nr:dephospho-CoA kinase [Bacteroidaceae bacterium]
MGKLVLGITGGIGSGKSYISSLLCEQLSVPVYDCDTEAKRLMAEDKSIQQQLMNLVGAHVYKAGKLQKDVLADYLFANQQNASQVNAIVHPAVKDDFRRWTALQKADLVAIESAILYESGFVSLADKVLYVDASKELRIQRVMQRDGSTRQQVEVRMNMQKAEEQRQKADFIIENEGAQQETLLAALKNILKIIN